MEVLYLFDVYTCMYLFSKCKNVFDEYYLTSVYVTLLERTHPCSSLTLGRRCTSLASTDMVTWQPSSMCVLSHTYAPSKLTFSPETLACGHAIYMYKYHHGLPPNYVNEMFSPYNTNHTYNTRYGNQRRIPKHNTNIIIYTISLAGPKIWNSIATNIQNMPPVMFKQFVKSFKWWNSCKLKHTECTNQWNEQYYNLNACKIHKHMYYKYWRQKTWKDLFP